MNEARDHRKITNARMNSFVQMLFSISPLENKLTKGW